MHRKTAASQVRKHRFRYARSERYREVIWKSIRNGSESNQKSIQHQSKTDHNRPKIVKLIQNLSKILQKGHQKTDIL